MPLTIVISNLIKFGIQLLVFIGFYIYFVCLKEAYNVIINYTIVLFPVYIFIMALLGLGFGMIISSLTTKYRDLTFLVTFGVSTINVCVCCNVSLIRLAKNKLPNYVTVLVEYNPITHNY